MRVKKEIPGSLKEPGIFIQKYRQKSRSKKKRLCNYLTVFTTFSNALGLFIAKSASTLRLSAIPLALTLPINSE